MPTFRDIFKPCFIDPGNSGRHNREVHAVYDGMGIAGLALTAAGVLFDLFEAGFDFSSCAIVLALS
ncbi:MAG: hypothetical protein PHY29_06080 [Syntrophales bacterium]|nr:hypothetical protein [Syntrophales bacterium]